jgi:RNA polymerase sigma factor for flagellar operon FliA
VKSPSLDSSDVLGRVHAELDLVELNARQIARRLSASSITLDDLRSFGREGLLSAARSYDAGRGVPFRRWANLRIRGAMIDGVRQWGSLPRRVYRDLRALSAADRVQEFYDAEDAAQPAPTPESADERLSEYLAGIATAIAMGTLATADADGTARADPEETPEALVAQAELVERLKSAVSGLPDRLRTLIERHYFADETLEQAAASLGLSKSWGSRLHAHAIEAITRELRRLK